MSARKLQTEIDRVLKKIEEGESQFDDTLEKVQTADSQNLKEKFEAELKKEIKRLQKFRDQVKSWASSNEVKQKRPLLDARHSIEKRMEIFKQIEKESKTKAYSKEGLQIAKRKKREAKNDPRTPSLEWLNETCGVMKEKLEEFEDRLDEIKSGGKKSIKEHADEVERLNQFTEWHQWHIEKLTDAIERLEQKEIRYQNVEDLKEDVEFYMDSYEDPDYYFDDGMYDILDEEPDEEDSDETDSEEERREEEERKAAEEVEAKKKRAEEKRKEQLEREKRLLAKAAEDKVKMDIAVKEKAARKTSKKQAISNEVEPQVNSPVVPVSYSTPQHSQPSSRHSSMGQSTSSRPSSTGPSSASVVSSSVPPSSSSSSSTTASAPTSAAAVVGGAPQQGTISGPVVSAPPNIPHPAGAVPTEPVVESESMNSRGDQPMTMAAILKKQQQMKTDGAAASANTAGDYSSLTGPGSFDSPLLPNATSLSSGPGGLPSSSGVPQRSSHPRAQVSVEYMETLRILEPAIRSIPSPLDSDRPKQYVPRNPYHTPAEFPQMPASIFDEPNIFDKFDTDTLFFIFYFHQGTPHQYLAARALKKQSWRYHKNFLTWFQRHDDPKYTSEEYEQGTYVYFDYETGWCQRIKREFTFHYRHLEDELQVTQ